VVAIQINIAQSKVWGQK